MQPPNQSTVNFMGSLMNVIVAVTDYNKCIYSKSAGGWFDSTGREIAGTTLLRMLRNALDVQGLCGLDRLFSFTISHRIKSAVEQYRRDVRICRVAFSAKIFFHSN